MMMVGPMKRKVIITAVVAFIIPVILFAAIGFIVIKSYNDKINELQVKGELVDRYVFTGSFSTNHKIVEDDFEIAQVKAAGAPKDSYSNVMVGRDGAGESGSYIYIGNSDMLIGKILKINVEPNTVITKSMFYEDDNIPTIDERLQEFNMVLLPSDIAENDYVDIRILFPNGEDYSVIVAKRIERISAGINDVSSVDTNTIAMKLTEEEIIRIGCAIIESYIVDGTKLYANKYVEPSTQLYEYTKINYIAKYNDAVTILKDDIRTQKEAEVKSKAIAQNPQITNEQLAALVEQINITDNDIDIQNVANMIGLSLPETKEVQKAVNGDLQLKSKYENMTVATYRSIASTYPVKPNVAAIIQSNPNIIQEIKNKYNIASLEAQRINMISTEVTTIDPYTGQEVLNENAQKVLKAIEREIEIQKAERQAYLNSLVNAQ